jgi:hypothetical protein
MLQSSVCPGNSPLLFRTRLEMCYCVHKQEFLLSNCQTNPRDLFIRRSVFKYRLRLSDIPDEGVLVLA